MARVTITITGVPEVRTRLTEIGEKAAANLQKQINQLGSDTESAWKQITHRRSGRLQEADKVQPGELSFSMLNPTYYYNWVNDGHNTPYGWRTKHGYRRAKRRSHVEGQQMTEKTVQFVEDNILNYCAKFLDGV